MDIKDIILFILIILIIYLFYKTKKMEKFSTIEDNIKDAINDKYKADLQYIRDLSDFSTSIREFSVTNTLPTDTTFQRNLIINGDLTVNGDVKFNNKDTNIMNIFPAYSIVAWASENIPKGWAKCTGEYYYLNEEGIAISTKIVTSDTILTPDLRSRFIIGVNNHSTFILYTPGDNDELLFAKWDNSNVYKHGQAYGEEKVTLIEREMPSHYHMYHECILNSVYDEDTGTSNIITDSYTSEKIKTLKMGWYPTNNHIQYEPLHTSGGSKPHNNLPPFCALYYIMKIKYE
jgi:microcystin-dependent protein